MPPEVSLLYRITFDNPGLFVFPYETEYCSFKVCEELCWDFDGECIESPDCFDRIANFTMLILSIQEHGRSFHFLVSSSIYFFKDLSSCQVGLSLVWLVLPQDILCYLLLL